MTEKTAPYFAKLDERLANQKFMHGDKLMMTDFWLSKLWIEFACNETHPWCAQWKAAFAPYANLTRHGEYIAEELREYLDAR